MFETENESVETNSDASTEASSEPQESTNTQSEAQSTETTQQMSADENKTKTDTANTPFHEHPRFKELVAQKNEYAERLKAFEARTAEYEKQLRQINERVNPAKPDKRQELLARLKGIDPEFGELMENVVSNSDQARMLAEWRQQQELVQVRERAVNTVNQLHETHKVAKEDRELYNTLIEAEATRNPNATLNDLPAIYKAVHEKMNGRIEAIKRAERESYVTGKKADSSIPPSQQKGKPVSTNKDFQYSKDPYEARQQLVSRILKQAKSSNDF